jgi:hypothetical protein
VTESQLQDQIRLVLGSRPDRLVVWRNNCGSAVLRNGFRVAFGVGNPGGADLLGLTHTGRFLAIEIKTPTGRQSPEQRNFESIVSNLNGHYLIMRSVDEARAFLESL